MCLSSAEEGLEVISNRAVVVQALSSSCQGPVLQLGHIQSQWEQEELLGRDKDRLAGTAVPAVLDLSLWHKAGEVEVRGNQTEQPPEGVVEGLQRVLAAVKQDAEATFMRQEGGHFQIIMSTELVHLDQAIHSIFLEMREEMESTWHLVLQMLTIV